MNLKKLSITAAMLFASGSVFAQTLDCAALANSADAEPAGYAAQCGTFDLTPRVESTNAPSDTGWSLDVRGDARPQNTLATFTLNAFATQTQVGAATNPNVFALDFDPTGTTLYAVPSSTSAVNPSALGTIDTTTGAFTPIATVTGIGDGNSTGLTIDPASGAAFLSTFSATTGSELFSLDLATAVATPIGNMSPAGLIIDIAMNCDGQMFGHNTTDDSLYSVNPATGAITLVGPHGLAANFAQGMDFDNDDGQLYAFIYTGGGTNTFGTFNLATGAINALSTNAPLGEFEGAIPTTCAVPGAIGVSTSNISFGGIAPSGSATSTLTLSNTGGSTFNVTGLSGLAAPFSITGGTCGATPFPLTAGASCTVNITFNAGTTVGTFSDSLQVVTDLPSTTDVSVSGSVNLAPPAFIPSNSTWGLLALLGLMLGLGGLMLRQRGA